MSRFDDEITAQPLSNIRTPALVLDSEILQRNLDAMSERAKQHNVDLRPHLKTAKSVEVGKRATAGHSGGITVSTLAEAAYFRAHGFTDITYGIPISPDKIDEAAALQHDGAWINLLCENVDTARTIANRADALGAQFRVFIEIDCGDRRTGVEPSGDELLPIAQALAGSSNVEVRGVLTHAGQSYKAKGIDAIKAVAEQEREAAVIAADRLRKNGFACPVVAPGSTPTAVLGDSWDGCTEIRPGNYVFYDLFMAGHGVCTIHDIAVSVLTTVIAHRPNSNRMYVDAGGLAMSKDTMAEANTENVGYGLVCDAHGTLIDSLYVQATSQEHGWVAPRDRNAAIPFDRFPIGTRLRILPNHSCMTAAAFDRYHVVEGNDIISAVWPRVNGW